MKSVKRFISVLLTIALLASTIPTLAVEETTKAKDFVNVQLSSEQVNILRFYEKNDNAGFDPTAALASWAFSTAMTQGFNGLMDAFFGGKGQEESPFPEIFEHLEEINAKLDTVIKDLTEMSKALSVMQQSVELGDIQAYLTEYSLELVKTTNSFKFLWNTVKEIEEDMYEQTEKDPEVYRQEKLLQLFLDQMGDTKPESVNTNMDLLYTNIMAYTSGSYQFSVNGKPKVSNLLGLYMQFARLIYPWENDRSLDAVKNYIDSIYCQYMVISILESIALEARIAKCEESGIDHQGIENLLNDTLKENVKAVSESYMYYTDEIEEARNDDVVRLWHPKYNIAFDKQLYQTEPPKEYVFQQEDMKSENYNTGSVEKLYGVIGDRIYNYKNVDTKTQAAKDFWGKMNQPSNGSLPDNDVVVGSVELNSIYDVYGLLGADSASMAFKNILTEGGFNIPDIPSWQYPAVVLNTEDQDHPLSFDNHRDAIRGTYDYWSYIRYNATVTGLYLTQKSPEYYTLPTYSYYIHDAHGTEQDDDYQKYAGCGPGICESPYGIDVVAPVVADLLMCAKTSETYKVAYKWEGNIPDGVTLPTDTTVYKWHDKPVVDTTYTEGMTKKIGDTVYTFSGWNASVDKDLTSDGLIEGNVTFRGVWSTSAVQ